MMRASLQGRTFLVLALVVLLSCASSAGNICASRDPNVIQYQHSERGNLLIKRSRPQLTPQWLPGGDRIIFASWPSPGLYTKEEVSALYAVNTDGRNLKRTSAKRTGLDFDFDHSPDLSPDGAWVVYTTTRHKVEDREKYPPPNNWLERNFEIESSRMDGSDRRKLTTHLMQDLHPVWSPDGSRIAFARTDLGGDEEDAGIYVMDADGQNPRQIFQFNHTLLNPQSGIREVRDQTYKAGPEWSPDGKTLSFIVSAVIGIGGHYGTGIRGAMQVDILYAVKSDASEPRELLVTLHDNIQNLHYSMGWSPYGSSIAVVTSINEKYEGAANVTVIHQRGFTPDEGEFLYETYAEPTVATPEYSLLVVDADSAAVQEVASGLPLGERKGRWDPVPLPNIMWSPDASRLLFSHRNTVYALTLEDGDLKRIAEGSHASWSPDGQAIAIVNPASDNYLTLVRENEGQQVLVSRSTLAQHE